MLDIRIMQFLCLVSWQPLATQLGWSQYENNRYHQKMIVVSFAFSNCHTAVVSAPINENNSVQNFFFLRTYFFQFEIENKSIRKYLVKYNSILNRFP